MGRGLFAIRDLRKGEIIIVEEAMVMAQAGGELR